MTHDIEKLKETIRDDMGEHLGGNILLCQEHAILYALRWLSERGLLAMDGRVVDIINSPSSMDEDSQTVTLTMENYAKLFEYYQRGKQYAANMGKYPLDTITDIRVLKDMYDQAHKDHIRAGKTENVELFNSSADKGRAIAKHYKTLLSIYGLGERDNDNLLKSTASSPGQAQGDE